MDILNTITAAQDMLQHVGGVLGSMIVVVGSVSALFKPVRQWVSNRLSMRQRDIQEQLRRMEDLIKKVDAENLDQNAKIDLIKQSNMCMCRNTLTHIYYKAKQDGGISDYNRENFEKLYEAYTALGGNSYVHEIRDEIIKMDRIK